MWVGTALVNCGGRDGQRRSMIVLTSAICSAWERMILPKGLHIDTVRIAIASLIMCQ